MASRVYMARRMMERLVAQHCHDVGGYGYSYSPGVVAYFGYGVSVLRAVSWVCLENHEAMC